MYAADNFLVRADGFELGCFDSWLDDLINGVKSIVRPSASGFLPKGINTKHRGLVMRVIC